MAKIQYDGPEMFRPIGAWAYVGYTLLFMIPVVGFVLMIVFACSSSNLNRRNYARSYICWWLLGLLLLGSAVFMAVRSTEVRQWLDRNVPQIENVIRSIEGKTESIASSAVKAVQDVLPNTANKTEETNGAATDDKAKATAAPTERSVRTTDQTDHATPALSSIQKVFIREEVKEAIDGYEAFFKEYADFCKKYYGSNAKTSEMMADYIQMMTLLAENEKKWDAFEDEHDLNDAEALYFYDANIRVQRYLLEASAAMEGK